MIAEKITNIGSENLNHDVKILKCISMVQTHIIHIQMLQPLTSPWTIPAPSDSDQWAALAP